MPYNLVKKKGARPWKIIQKTTGKIVGTSTSKAKATRSIGYRETAESQVKKRTKK